MGREMVLSARMQAVADMVTKGNRVCDVGCDHGYVSIYLVRRGISPAVLAMDVNRGPLGRAKEHVEEAGLGKYITLRLSDGLDAYEPGEAETLICAGMGGRLMERILDRTTSKTKDFKELILQPQSEIPFFRKYLRNAGYEITWEDMILEENKFYPIIKAVPAEGKPEASDQSLCDRFGPVLLKRRHPVLRMYLEREWESCLAIRERLSEAQNTPRTQSRLEALKEEMDCLEKAAKKMGMVKKRGREGYGDCYD